MKAIIIFASVILSLPTLSFSQQNDCCKKAECCEQKTVKPVVTKGYYAIGNNAKKLARKADLPLCCDTTEGNKVAQKRSSQVSKGYYAIGNNEEKLNSTVTGETTVSTPAVQKGYYAIGDNAKKLNTGRNRADCCDCCN